MGAVLRGRGARGDALFLQRGIAMRDELSSERGEHRELRKLAEFTKFHVPKVASAESWIIPAQLPKLHAR